MHGISSWRALKGSALANTRMDHDEHVRFQRKSLIDAPGVDTSTDTDSRGRRAGRSQVMR
jgi:hypothetical protein